VITYNKYEKNSIEKLQNKHRYKKEMKHWDENCAVDCNEGTRLDCS